MNKKLTKKEIEFQKRLTAKRERDRKKYKTPTSPIITTNNPIPLQIGKKNDDGFIQSNNIVTHDGKIPDFLKKDGWTLYRIEFEKGHIKGFHESDENNFEPTEYKIVKRGTTLVKICKNKFRISLIDYKEQKKYAVSQISFLECKKLLPQYKIDNANLGVYHDSEKRKIIYANTIAKFVEISNRAQNDIEVAKDHKKVLEIFESVVWPDKLITD